MHKTKIAFYHDVRYEICIWYQVQKKALKFKMKSSKMLILQPFWFVLINCIFVENPKLYHN